MEDLVRSRRPRRPPERFRCVRNSVVVIGELDGDIMLDARVGAQHVGEGGASRGNAYVLLPDTDDTVRAEWKISSKAVVETSVALVNALALGRGPLQLLVRTLTGRTITFDVELEAPSIM